MKGILVLHGMGPSVRASDESARSGYDRHLRKNLRDQLGGQWNDDLYYPVVYQDLLQEGQTNMLNRMTQAYDLDSMMLRKPLTHNFSDATAYLTTSRNPDGGIYRAIQERIQSGLQALYANGARDLAVVAASLGGRVFTDYFGMRKTSRIKRSSPTCPTMRWGIFAEVRP